MYVLSLIVAMLTMLRRTPQHVDEYIQIILPSLYRSYYFEVHESHLVSVNYVIIGLGNVLSTVRHQANACNKTDLWKKWPSGTKFNDILI